MCFLLAPPGQTLLETDCPSLNRPLTVFDFRDDFGSKLSGILFYYYSGDIWFLYIYASVELVDESQKYVLIGSD